MRHTPYLHAGNCNPNQGLISIDEQRGKPACYLLAPPEMEHTFTISLAGCQHDFSPVSMASQIGRGSPCSFFHILKQLDLREIEG
jgi:hypothetical protein